MKIPKYVQELMARSEFEFDRCTANQFYAAGYTIRIHKYSDFEHIDTFHNEVQRLRKWVEHQTGGSFYLLYSEGNTTEYFDQFVVVTIYDPVMKYLEKLIPEKYNPKSK